MDDLQKSKMRSISYWFVDGISEIGTGLVITLMGSLFMLTRYLPQESKLNWVISYGQPVIILIAFLIIAKLVRFFKERVTFPRTGFVSYLRPKTNQRIKRGVLAGSAAMAVSIITTLVSGTLNQRFIPLFIGALLTIALVVFAFNYGIKRLYVVGLVTLMTGTLLCLLDLPDLLSYSWLFIGLGVSMMLGGLAAMVHYLRTTQPASMEELE